MEKAKAALRFSIPKHIATGLENVARVVEEEGVRGCVFFWFVVWVVVVMVLVCGFVCECMGARGRSTRLSSVVHPIHHQKTEPHQQPTNPSYKP